MKYDDYPPQSWFLAKSTFFHTYTHQVDSELFPIVALLMRNIETSIKNTHLFMYSNNISYKC
jgi:hypothetical protein